MNPCCSSSGEPLPEAHASIRVFRVPETFFFGLNLHRGLWCRMGLGEHHTGSRFLLFVTLLEGFRGSVAKSSLVFTHWWFEGTQRMEYGDYYWGVDYRDLS